MAIEAKIVGGPELRRRLKKLTPAQNAKITGPALVESMLLTLRIAARDKIYPGGGGEPRDGILTSRTGRLRGSLTAGFATDHSGLPDSITGGSNVVYAAVHEFGFPKRNIPKRPYLAPALADASKQFNSIFAKHWQKAADGR